MECAILENYLYRSILEKNICSTEIIRSVISKQMDSVAFFQYDLTLDTKRLNIIKLIGWTGIQCQNWEIVDLSIEHYTKIYEMIVNNSLPMFQKYGPETIKKQIDAMKSGQKDILDLLKFLDMQNVFSIYENLF